MTASKVLVIFYSRTGATRRLAEALANALQADIEPITDRINRSGIFGYLRSVAESLQKRGASIEPMKTDPASYDLVVIGTPVWGCPYKRYRRQSDLTWQPNRGTSA